MAAATAGTYGMLLWSPHGGLYYFPFYNFDLYGEPRLGYCPYSLTLSDVPSCRL